MAKTKATKTEARYRGRPNGTERCGRCTMFEPPDQCSAVQGEVIPQGWCRFFELKRGRSRWYEEDKR